MAGVNAVKSLSFNKSSILLIVARSFESLYKETDGTI